MKMVLGNPCAVEAQTLRVADLFGRQPVARLRGALIEQTGKKAEAFRHYAFSVWACAKRGETWGMAAISSRV